MSYNVLSGAKGGSAPPAPTMTPDNLRSTDRMETVLAVSEGQIKGLSEGAKSFFIGDTPLVSHEGRQNFEGFRLDLTRGEADPPSIKPILGGKATSSAVNVELKNSLDVTRQTTKTNINFLDLRFVISRLMRMDEKGGTYNNTLNFNVYFKPKSQSVWHRAPGSWLVDNLNQDGSVYSSSNYAHGVILKLGNYWEGDEYGGSSYWTQFGAILTPPTYRNLRRYVRFRWRKDGGSWTYETRDGGTIRQNKEYVTWTTQETDPRGPTTTTAYHSAYVFQPYSWEHDFTINEGPGTYEVEVLSGTLTIGKQKQAGPYSITGKTTSNYPYEITIDVPEINEPFDIKVEKVSPDTTEDGLSYTDIVWESFQEVVAQNFYHPNTALVRLYGSANNQFSSIPEFKGVYKGIIVKVPTNYDPEARTYSGAWDGTFKMAWTNNPAWILYDFVTNERYGVRSYYTGVNIDKWEVYDAAQWCDTMVPDGRGGGQPRYTFNAVIAEPRSGHEMLKYIAGTFNAAAFDDLNGNIILRVDRDDPATALFTPESVTEEGFEYSYTDLNSRYNDITVAFTNPTLNWQTDRRRVYNQESIDKLGRIPLDFVAVGCTNAQEAIRRAQYKLITSLTETEMVSFRTNRMGQIVAPFDVILIADPDMGYSLSGRIKSLSADRKTVTLRDEVYLEPGIQYYLEVETTTGPYKVGVVQGADLSLTEIQLNAALPSNVPDKAVFSLQSEEGSGLPKPYRVLTVGEGETPDQMSITAIEINRNKWADADTLQFSDEIEYSVLGDPYTVPGPDFVRFEERFNSKSRQFELVVNPLLDTANYKFYSTDFEVWSRPAYTSQPFIKRELTAGSLVIDHPTGEYEFKILPKSLVGAKAQLSQVQGFYFDVQGKAAPPVGAFNLQATATYEGVRLKWDAFDDLDPITYEIREGLSWDDGDELVIGLKATSFNILYEDAKERTFHVRAKDDLGNYSLNVATVTAAPLLPEDVPDFVATQQGDHINFRWEQVPGNRMRYEIRVGASFEKGQFVTVAGGDTTTIMYPSPGTKTFWIKALAPTGLYSSVGRYSVATNTPIVNRNIVFKEDHVAEKWPGIHHFMTEEVDGSIATPQGVNKGVYYAGVNLGRRLKGRTWVDTELDLLPNPWSWDDLNTPWDEMTTPWDPADDLSGTDLSLHISTRIPDYTMSELEIFKLDGNTGGIGGTVAKEELGTSYQTGQFYDGLNVTDLTTTSWDVSIPSEFSQLFTISYPKDVAGEVVFMTFKGPNGWLRVGYDGDFLLYDSAENIIRVSHNGNLNDVFTLGVSQSSTTRYLFIRSLKSDSIHSGYAETPPVGTFSSIHLYSTE